MTKGKVKPTSIRIPEKLLAKIDTMCNDDNCSRNDYIISVLEASTEETDHQGTSKEIKPKPRPKQDYTVVLDNGTTAKSKVVIDPNRNSITYYDSNGKFLYETPDDKRFPIREPIPKAKIVRIIE